MPALSARLSRSDFETAIKAFLTQTKQHAPWSYIQHPSPLGQPAQGYLSLNQIAPDQSQRFHNHQQLQQRQKSFDTDQAILDELSEENGHILGEEDEVDDLVVSGAGSDPVIAQGTATTDAFLSVSYHIVFSPSYQVPVLYFNAFRPDGTAIGLEEIYESLVPEEWRSSVRDAGLSGGISQQDHPLLNVPYFYMHPCETVSLMETILKNQEQEQEPNSHSSYLNSYISTWLSFTGQAIGISVPSASLVTQDW
ncbi:hypothetical protein BGZ83_009700 [Gryganskiella cystojenkinii]|nr:hypothetical protein BGZ83_009700 [Gryganskiella cystojenkinii]